MIMNEEAKIDLVLSSQKYLDGLKQVDAKTTQSQQVLTKVFTKLERDAQGAAAQFALLGDESKKLAKEKEALHKAIVTLTKEGFKKDSDEVWALTKDYRNLEAQERSLAEEAKNLEAKEAALANEAKNASKEHKTLGERFASLRDTMQGPIAAAKMVVDAVRKIGAVVVENVTEYVESEKAFNKLNAAFVASGDTSGVASRSIQRLAGELQDLTNIDEESIQSSAGLLRSIANLDKDGIERLLPKILDMSAALGIDLETATKQVASALAGGKNSLSKYGIEVDKSASSTERLVAISDQLSKKWGGTAAALSNVVDGIKMQAGEMKEAIGELLLYDFGGLAEHYKNGMKIATDAIKDGIKKAKESDIIDSLMGGESFTSVETKMKAVGMTWTNVLAELYAKQAALQDKIAHPDLATSTAASIEADATKTQKELKSIQGKIEAVTAQNQASIALARAEADEAERKRKSALAAEESAKAEEKIAKLNDTAVSGNPYKSLVSDMANYRNETSQLTEEEKKLQRAAENAMAAAFDKDNADSQSLATIESLTDAQRNQIRAAESATAATFDSGNADSQAMQTKEEYINTLDRQGKKLKEVAAGELALKDAAVSGFEATAEAMGEAFVAGNDGWKALGQAAKNSIAGIVKAMAMEAEIKFGSALVDVFMGDVTKVPAVAEAGALIGLAYAAAGAISAIPMAGGGSGTATKPTLFLSGEAGAEDYVFAPRSKGGLKKSPVIRELVEAETSDISKQKNYADPANYIPIESAECKDMAVQTVIAAREGYSDNRSDVFEARAGLTKSHAVINGENESTKKKDTATNPDYYAPSVETVSGSGTVNNFHYHIAGSVIRERDLGMLGASQMARAQRGY